MVMKDTICRLACRKILCVILLGGLLCNSAWGQNEEVQFAIPGEFEEPYTQLNFFEDGGIDVDSNGTVDIVNPCTCQANPPIQNGETANGWFLDQAVVATGVSGQLWLIENAQFAFLDTEGLSVFPGDTLQEIGTTGVYVLPFYHQSGQQYNILVEAPNDYPGASFGPVSARCFYPTPFIPNLDTLFCSFEDDVNIEVEISTGVGGWIPVLPETESWEITRLDDGMIWTEPFFSPGDYGPGDYLVSHTLYAGDDPYNAYHSTGCETTVELMVRVEASVPTMACNGLINISIGPSCTQTIIPELILAGTPPPGATFEIEVFAPDGTSLGDEVSAEYDGQTLSVDITDNCSGSTCSSAIFIRDLIPPTLTLPADVDLACTDSDHPDNTGVAVATDCNVVELTYSDSVWENECADPTIVITRSWRAEDAAGNVTIDDQLIRIYRAGPESFLFPGEVIVPCDDYQLDPSLTDPTPEGAGIPTLVDEPRCRLIYTHQDDTIPSMGFDFVILRTWILLDLCGAELYEVDAAGNDNVQFIRVADQDPPVLTLEPIELNATEPPDFIGGPCTTVGYLPPPVTVDDCSGVSVRIFTPLGEAEYLDGISGLSGGYVPEPGLPLGTYEIVYEAIDERDNTEYYTVNATVVDNTGPSMLCNGSLDVTLQSDGLARLHPEDIDEGSRDDCCTDIFQVKLLSEPDSLFRDFIDFDCTNDTVTVVLQLADCAGNVNSCESIITVRDNIPVEVTNEPQDVVLTCLDDLGDYSDSEFMAPTFTDVCEFGVSFIAENFLDDCGAGEIIRTWTASDDPQNPLVIVSQTVTVEPYFDYQIAIPGDDSFDCGDDYTYSSLELLGSSGCEMVALNVVTDTLPSPEDGCYRLSRTHSIINWCTYDENTPPFVLPRLDGDDEGNVLGDPYTFRVEGTDAYTLIDANNTFIGPATGQYEYIQYIKVFDETPPVLTTPPAAGACLDNFNDCTASIMVPFTATDECFFPVDVSYQFRTATGLFEPDPYGSLVQQGDNWVIQGDYPAGEYVLLVMAADGCGNAVESEIALFAEDCIPPEMECIQEELIFYLPDTNGIWLQPEDLLSSATDDCGTVSISFGSQDSLFLNCEDLGPQMQTVYAQDGSNGQESNCTVEFVLADTILACTPNVKIEGFIRREDNEAVVGVEVSLVGAVNTNTITDEEGYYQFDDLPPGEDYLVIPSHNINHPNGVTTLDIIRVSKHVLFVTLLDSPYKMISADANRSGAVTTLDMIRMRKVILNVDSAFADNTSWRFVPSDYVFPNQGNPWTEAFPERASLVNVLQSTLVNFVAMKTGDVNNSAQTSPFAGDEVDTRDPLFWPVEDRHVQAGEQFDLILKATESNWEGGQLSLRWSTEVVQFSQVISTEYTTPDHYNLLQTATGQLSLCWHEDAELGDPVIRIQFEALRDGQLSNWFQIADTPTPALVYQAFAGIEYEAKRPFLVWEPQAVGASFRTTKVRAYPNPWQDRVHFEWQVQEPGQAELRLFDKLGRLLYQQEQRMEPGQATWTISDDQLPLSAGLLFYECQIGKEVFRGKLLRAKP